MKELFNTKNLVLMAVFAALGGDSYVREFPIPFIAPGFYEMDLSRSTCTYRLLYCRPCGRSYNGSGQNYH